MIGVFCAALVQDLTGANALVSILIGFFGGGALFGGAVALAPRVMFYGLVALYAIGGFSIARYFDWGAFESIVLTVFAGGLGWAANVSFAQDAFFNQLDAKEAQDAQDVEDGQKSDLAPVKSVLKAELFEDAATSYKSGLISPEVYDRICSEIDKLAGGKKRSDQPAAARSMKQKPIADLNQDDELALVNLRELRLIRETEWQEVTRGMDEATTSAGAAASHSDALFRLAECRAISMETFLRAMLKVDGDYPPHAAKQVNFPYSEPEPNAKQQATALFDAKLIDFEEYQNALSAIAK